MIGKEVSRVAQLAGHEVVILSRRSGAGAGGVRMVHWDGRTLGEWRKELEGAHTVVNLSGASIAARWKKGYLDTLYASRVEPTRVIGEAIGLCAVPPTCWVNASGIGIFGDTGTRTVSESSPNGTGQIADLAHRWEFAQEEAPTTACRKVRLRIGMVLGREGGAFPMLSLLTKAFLGGALGSGKQYQPWIHVTDVARMALWAAETDVTGPLNCVAPQMVTQADFMAAFRAAYGRPPAPPAPKFAVEAVSQFMGWPKDFLLSGQRAEPAMAKAWGFEWQYPALVDALGELTR